MDVGGNKELHSRRVAAATQDKDSACQDSALCPAKNDQRETRVPLTFFPHTRIAVTNTSGRKKGWRISKGYIYKGK